MSYPLDPELEPWLASQPEFPFDDLPRWRVMLSEFYRASADDEMPGRPFTTTERMIDGGSGSACRVRIYRPIGLVGPTPAVLFIHGGGFILGDLDIEHWLAGRVSAQAEVIVVSVDYRLAPEHPYPAAVDDCMAALRWLAKEAPALGTSPSQIAVAGNSAGGCLAAATALRARDEGGPPLCFQYLGIPVVDDRLTSESMTAYTDTPVWSRPLAEISWRYYLGERAGSADVSPYAAPARATDLTGLPPAFVAVSQYDPLRDEGVEYGRRLMQAGIATELHVYPSTCHGVSADQTSDVGRRIVADEVRALRAAFRRG